MLKGFSGVVLLAWDLKAMRDFYAQVGIVLDSQPDGSIKGTVGDFVIEVKAARHSGPTTMTSLNFTVDSLSAIRRALSGARLVEEGRTRLVVEDPQGHRIGFTLPEPRQAA